MDDCIYVILGTCVTEEKLVAICVLLAGLILMVAGLYFYFRTKSESDAVGLVKIDPAVKKVSTKTPPLEIAGPTVKKTRPYAIGSVLYVGKSVDGLGVRFEVLGYDENGELKDIECKMEAQVPVGAVDIRVHHQMGDVYMHGEAVVTYSLNGQAVNEIIGLSDDGLEKSDFRLIVKVSKSTFEEIKAK